MNAQIEGHPVFVREGVASRCVVIDHLVLCSRVAPCALGAESFESSFGVAKGIDMIALRAGRQRFSWQGPRGGRRARERHCPHRPPPGSLICGAISPLLLYGNNYWEEGRG